MEKIGEIIRKHRKLKNLTQEELGEKLFVSKQAISKWENGRSLPDLETTQKLIETLEIEPGEILGGTIREVKKNRKFLIILSVVCAIISVIILISIGNRYYKKALIEFGYQDGINPSNQYATDVSLIQLIANPDKYHGELIRVIGVGNLEFEGNCVAISKESLKYNYKNSVWLELGKRAISYEEAQKFNGKYVIIEGIFDKNDCGHFGMFCGSIKNISRYQLWETNRYYDVLSMYTITKNPDSTYSYKIADKNGNTLFSKDNASREPEIEQVNTYVLGLTVQTGTGLSTNWSVYCDVENGKTSETFNYVLAAQGKYVIFVEIENGKHNIVVQNIFDKSLYCKKYPLVNCSEVAGDIVTDAKINGEGIIIIKYLSGEHFKESEFTIKFP